MSERHTAADIKNFHAAFRTLTTLLSYVQSPTGTRHGRSQSEVGPTNGKDLTSLKVLDALSTLLIREHEIFAVVVAPSDDGIENQVFYSSLYLILAEPLTIRGPSRLLLRRMRYAHGLRPGLA